MDATYKQIADEVHRAEKFTVKTCWIADVKNSLGIPMRRAWNRQGAGRIHPYPPDKRGPIIAAMKRLKAV